MYHNLKGEKIYYSVPPTHKNEILNLAMVGETVPNTEFKALHQSELDPENVMYTFEYITKGKLIINQGRKVCTACEGDIVLLNANGSHYYYSDPKDAVGKYFIVCNGPYVDKLIEAFRIQDSTVIRRADFSAAFLNLFTVIQTNPDALLQTTAELILKFMFAMNPIVNRNARSSSASSYPLHMQIANYIESHIQEELRLQHLASEFSVSPVTINRIFKENFGVTPKQYILNSKIEMSKHLLSVMDLPINRISDYLSFSHQNNFATAFTKITGLSPSQYRKKYRYLSDSDSGD